jgi:hypothetical protein
MSVVGYGVKGFYCCDNLTSVKFSFSENAQNHQVKTTDKSDCCKTKYQYFKVKDNHFAADHISSPLNLFTEVNLFTASFQPVLYAPQKINIANPGNATPLYKGVPIQISYCTFLI